MEVALVSNALEEVYPRRLQRTRLTAGDFKAVLPIVLPDGMTKY